MLQEAVSTDVDHLMIPDVLEEDMNDVIQDNCSVLWSTENAESLDLIPQLSGMGPDSSVLSTKKITIPDLMNSPEFNWLVHKEPLSRHNGSNNRKVFTHSSIVRKDTNKQISVVGASAKVLQNKHLFQFVSPFIDSGSYEIDAVRIIDGGRSVVVVMKNTGMGRIEAFKGDPIQAFTIARLTRGSIPQIHIGSMLYRLVCSNGLMRLDYMKEKVDTSGPVSIEGKKLAALMKRSSERAKVALEKMVEMAKVPMSVADNNEYFRRSMGLKWDDPELEFDCEEDRADHFAEMEKNQRVINRVLESTELMKGTMPIDRHDTLECSYQGLTDYITNRRSKNSATAFRELHWGSGAKIANRGFELALEMIDNKVVN